MDKRYYTDLHCHIIPGVDDGSPNMEESVKMLKKAYEMGVRNIIATPHYACGDHNAEPSRLEELRKQVEVEAKKISKHFNISLGNELLWSPDVVQAVKDGKANTMAGTRYILVEFSPNDSYRTIYNGLRSFILEGYIPIAAHIERYEALQNREDRVKELVDLGAYIQVNIGSMVGGLFDSHARFLKKLFNKGLIHFFASDAHDSTYRTCRFQECIDHIKKKVDVDYLSAVLYENPSLLYEDKYI